MTSIELVVACDQASGIARAGDLPWHLPGDLRHFRLVTTQARPGRRNAVIMGRRTWETIPPKYQPLAGRLNIVLTHQTDYDAPVPVCHSLQDAIDTAHAAHVDRVLIVGGAVVYTAALARRDCRRAFVTRIDHDFACDTFLPALDDSWILTAESLPIQENGVSYRYCVYDRLT